jgi:hypothetical protein
MHLNRLCVNVLKNDYFGGRELSYDGSCHTTHLNMPLELQEVEEPRTSRQCAHESGQIFGPVQQSPAVSLRQPSYSFLLEAE